MRSSKKRGPGRPRGRVTPHRPVLSARVPGDLHTRVVASARKHGRTASEEIVWLAEQGLLLTEALEDAAAIREKAFSDANALVAATSEDRLREIADQAAMRAVKKMKEAQS